MSGIQNFNSKLITILAVVIAATIAINAQVRPYRATDKQMEALLKKIETETDRFRSLVDRDLDQGPLNGTRYEDGVLDYIGGFEEATDRLSSGFRNRTSSSYDVEEVLGRASVVDGFVNRNLLSPQTNNQWSLLKRNLGTLANYYRTNWDWNNPRQGRNTYYNLTGTYRLNQSRSDDVLTVVERILNGLNISTSQRSRYRDQLMERLQAPETYAIDHSGRRFMIGSNLSPQVTFDADGVARWEKSPSGINARLTSNYDDMRGLTINFTGDRNNDYYSHFVRQNDGMLRVLRRVYVPNRNETVSVAWVYDRISDVAQWQFSPQEYNPWNNEGIRYGLNENTRVTATLYNSISTKTSQEGDRFQLEVQEPEAYRGAIITGRITSLEHSGRVSGNASIGFAFEGMRVRSGQTYGFSGVVNEVILPNGKRISVNNEGVIKEHSQTKSTVVRAGVGAAVGAIIGAISGGKKGAAIGAIVGAGVGVGSVLLQGRDEIELPQGTRFVITTRNGGTAVNFKK